MESRPRVGLVRLSANLPRRSRTTKLGLRPPGTFDDPVDGLNNGTDRGFTGHEHLGDIGIVHMNGRLYDPSGMLTGGYGYDGSGNLTTATGRAYRSIAYTSFNLPDSQNSASGPSRGSNYTWQCDEQHQRIKEMRVAAGGGREPPGCFIRTT